MLEQVRKLLLAMDAFGVTADAVLYVPLALLSDVQPEVTPAADANDPALIGTFEGIPVYCPALAELVERP